MRRAVGILALLAFVAAPAAAPASRGGLCSASERPHRLVLLRTGRGRAEVRWRATDGAAAYRLLRDGAVVGQTRQRRLAVNVTAGRRHRFVVQRLAPSGGVLCAGAARLRVGYRPPSAPRGVATTVGDASVAVSWRPARPGDAPIAGYRVIRDGRVTGQVRGTSKTITLSPGVTHHVAVRAVDSHGTTGPATRAVAVRAGHAPPPAPEALAVVDSSDHDVTLDWAPVTASTRVVGYRVLRDGVVTGQTEATRLVVAVAPDRDVRLTVVAVDALDTVSEESAPVTVRIGHRAPGATTGLQLTEVTSTQVRLRWDAAPGGSGPVAGYRVLRDGVVVAQVRGTDATVGGLAPATAYRFSVAAVDGQGYEGPVSDPLDVTTQAPPPTTGALHAFILASTDRSFHDFQAHYTQVGTVYPTYYDCRSSGSFAGADDPLITGWAQLRKVAVAPRINCQSGSTLHTILTDPEVRALTLAWMTAEAQHNGYDGLNLDFEAGFPSDRAALTSFVADLAAALHDDHRTLSVCVSAKTVDASTGRAAFYDYAALAAAADHVFVMNWGKHWSTSGPGAMDDLPWATKVADYVASLGTPARFILGFPLYGMDWAAGGGSGHPGTPLEYDDVTTLLAARGITPTLDGSVDAWHATYLDENGLGHDVWYGDATTEHARIKHARDRGFGVGVWRLGDEDQRLWDDPQLAPGA